MGMKLQKKNKEINLYLLVAFVVVISFVTQRLQSKNGRRRIAPFTFSRINSGYDINICTKTETVCLPFACPTEKASYPLSTSRAYLNTEETRYCSQSPRDRVECVGSARCKKN